MKKIYLDHSATTPVDPAVLDAMLPYLKNIFGNPSSLHSFGRSAKTAVEEAREKVAFLINADPVEIFFTCGGTEADNLAIIGAVSAHEKKKSHIITSSIEHPAVLTTCKYLEKAGSAVTCLPVDKHGLIDPLDVKKAIRSNTAIISIMHANNETGTIEPIKEIGLIARERDVSFHTDAVQTAGKIPIDVNDINVDMLSLSGHKIHGPKGVGVLYIRKGTKISPMFYGGHHEGGLRAGTENVPAIAGLGKACEISLNGLTLQMDHMKDLRDRLETGIKERIERIKINGHPSERLPNILNVSFEGIEGEPVILNLDKMGIAASAGSACTSDSAESSHVLKALGVSAELARASVRFSLGRGNTKNEIDFTVDTLKELVNRLRSDSTLQKNAGRKKQCLITFYETTDALHAEKVLKKKDMKSSLTSVPSGIKRPSCCGTALIFDCRDQEKIITYLKEQDVEIEGTHQLDIDAGQSKPAKKRFWPFSR